MRALESDLARNAARCRATIVFPVPADPETLAGPLKFLSTRLCWAGCRKPFLDHVPQFAEQVHLHVLVWVSPLGLQQPLCQVQHEGGCAKVAGIDQIQVNAFADDPLNSRTRWTDKGGIQMQPRLLGEVGDQVLLGRILPVAL